MITRLPISLATLPAEPGFSVLARNSAANAIRSTQEFCVATGLNKKKIRAGDPDALRLLGQLTGSNVSHLIADSPHQLHRKNTTLNGKTLLSRSVRKADLSVCPQCWSEAVETANFRPYHLPIRRDWLLHPIHTCSIHQTRLVELPFKDYSTCYDHVFRSQLDPFWLQNLPNRIVPQTLTVFEAAAIAHLDHNQELCPWLGKLQMDALERWCLGLGFFIEHGTGNPTDLKIDTCRQLVELGFETTISGQAVLHNAIDASLKRHSTRMGKTWLYGWAFQAARPTERVPFRALMKTICDDQGDYCLLSVRQVHSKAPLIEAEVRRIARREKRSVSWVKNVLSLDGFIPEDGIPKHKNLKQHMLSCDRHIAKVANGITAKMAAARLNIGSKAFEGLVSADIIKPMRTQALAKPRFEERTLDALLATIESHLEHKGPLEDHAYVSIPQACFAVSCTTANITELLLANCLPKAYSENRSKGLAGIQVNISELKAVLLMHATTGLTMSDLRDQLGLQYSEVEQLTTLKLLPSYSGRKEGSSRPALIVDPADLAKFLDEFQTNRTAAVLLNLSESEARAKILSSGIYRASVAGGLPIYRTADINAL